MSNSGIVGVALSGSGFRLGVHIGALQAILDKGYAINEIAGTSGGSIVAALYAVGFDPPKMYDILLHTPLSSFISWSLESIIAKRAFSNGDILMKWLNTYIGETTIFDHALIPLSVITTDLNQYKAFVFNKTDTPLALIAKACRASCSIPVVYEAVVEGSTFLVDGGVSDDLPANYLTADNKKFAIELFESSEPLGANSDVFTILGRVLDTILSVDNTTQLEGVINCTPIKITTPSGMSLDTGMTAAQIKQLYDLGYEATTAIISKL